jgi:putative alpha-1,2-mannosidase
VRQAMTQLYRPTPDGLAGSDDLGTLSAWYVWAAIGVYPEIPGVPILVLGSPLFPHLTWRLSGGDVTITAPAASATTPYVRSLSLDGHPYTKPWLPLAALAGGADLRATMSATPDTAWGSHRADAPPSFATGEAPARG